MMKRPLGSARPGQAPLGRNLNAPPSPPGAQVPTRLTPAPMSDETMARCRLGNPEATLRSSSIKTGKLAARLPWLFAIEPELSTITRISRSLGPTSNAFTVSSSGR
jgi:hypothetical protein